MVPPASPLAELGRRLAARRVESRVEVRELAARACVPADAIERFELGAGGLGAADLARLALVLGLPAASFVHTKAPQTAAPVEVAVLLKEAAPGYLADADRQALVTGLLRARSFTALREILSQPCLADEFKPYPATAERPHEDGYARALQVRELMPERPLALRGLRRLLEDRFDVLVLEHMFSDAHILGAACRSGRARLVAVNSSILSETVRRFVLAHELGHHLLDLKEQGAAADQGMYNDIRFWMDNSPTEKRANAFAAMFLAPREAVRTVVGPQVPNRDLVDARSLVERVCRESGIGFAAATWHLYNLKHLDRPTVDALMFTASEDHASGLEESSEFDGLERRVFAALAIDAISRSRAKELIGERLDALLARAHA